MAIHDFDRAIVDFSIRLAWDLMVGILIGNIRVSMNKKGYVIIINKRHHSVTLELLARKLGICLEKAKETLKATTQDCINSALLPLSRRYRTDLISQRLMRVSCTFYSGTLFEKQKSSIGNTCAHMFTDG